MYDTEPGSGWSQIADEAIHGPLYGTKLSIISSSHLIWKDWKERFPTTKVMALPVDANGDTLYSFTRDIYLSKQHVHGIVVNKNSIAFPLPIIETEKVVNLNFHDVSLVIAYGSGDVHVYRSDMVFSPSQNDNFMISDLQIEIDILTGKSLDNSVELERISGKTMFQFAWDNFHPQSAYYLGAAEVSSSYSNSDVVNFVGVYGLFTIILWMKTKQAKKSRNDFEA
ncbi:MAG: DUF3179 domain-containing protein [Candidatus Heimdallarchaeota archaeon]|nr:DUF3179 domain-containing protein [Candidatus Heimdallarchaeota archaeon]